MLLGERLRDEEERMELLSVLNTHCKSKLNLEQLYTVSLEIPEDKPAVSSKKGKRALQKAEETKTGDTIAMKEWYNNWNWKLILERLRAWYYSCRGADSGAKSLVMAPPPPVPGTEGLRALAWTQSLQRLFQLLGRAIKNAEPVLLVGDTGCGKTTVCQLYALLLGQPLHVVNCHAHSETADFLGGLRPVRSRASSAKALSAACQELLQHSARLWEELLRFRYLKRQSALPAVEEAKAASPAAGKKQKKKGKGGSKGVKVEEEAAVSVEVGGTYAFPAKLPNTVVLKALCPSPEGLSSDVSDSASPNVVVDYSSASVDDLLTAASKISTVLSAWKQEIRLVQSTLYESEQAKGDDRSAAEASGAGGGAGGAAEGVEASAFGAKRKAEPSTTSDKRRKQDGEASMKASLQSSELGIASLRAEQCLKQVQGLKAQVTKLKDAYQALFEWVDGPLVSPQHLLWSMTRALVTTLVSGPGNRYARGTFLPA